jgi:transcriptional regulator with XRE-family HTH domain
MQGIPRGHFYVVQLVPELAPNRIKLGWAADPSSRFGTIQHSAPTARLVRTWPAEHSWQRKVISAGRPGRQLGHGVFDSDDVGAVVERIDAFFNARGLTGVTPDVTEHPGAGAFRLPNLQTIRRRSFLSQAELAKSSGVTKLTISRIEHVGIRARMSTIRKLSAALKVKPEELIGQVPA